MQHRTFDEKCQECYLFFKRNRPQPGRFSISREDSVNTKEAFEFARGWAISGYSRLATERRGEKGVSIPHLFSARHRPILQYDLDAWSRLIAQLDHMSSRVCQDDERRAHLVAVVVARTFELKPRWALIKLQRQELPTELKLDPFQLWQMIALTKSSVKLICDQPSLEKASQQLDDILLFNFKKRKTPATAGI